MTADPDSVTVQLDWGNAFNSLSRQKMLDAAVLRCAALLPLAAWTYQAHTRLRVRGRPDAPILSMRGVRQGEPLGQLSLALTMPGALEELQQLALLARPRGPCGRYLPAGLHCWATAAFPILFDLAEHLGLEVLLGKCAAHSVDAAAGEWLQQSWASGLPLAAS
jgi:hypothetical protein